MYINFDEFSNLLKENITLNEDDCFKILNKIINNPNRYVGVFRITGAKAKLMQNISQSNEIMFGNFLEKIINKYLKITGYVNLNNEIQTNGEILKIDQLVKKDNDIFIIEQKVRDDHDSTKKRGQIDNFLKKYNHVKTIYPINNIVGIMWFVDDSFKKNKGFYHNEISNLNKYDRNLHLFYGKELFDFFELPHIWDELIEHLENFEKQNVDYSYDMQDFELSPNILSSLIKLPLRQWSKLTSDKAEYIKLRSKFFPKGNAIQKALDERKKLGK